MKGSPMIYTAWALFLILQNAAFTFVSRARNSGSYTLHAIAAVASNGMWIASQFVSLNILLDAIHRGSWPHALAIGMFYTTFTVSGSVLMHWVGVTYIEKGKRKVGA